MLYSPLSARTNHIRLLVLYPGDFGNPISCGLVHEDLDDLQTNFEALSYTWGSPDKTSTIQLNGQEFRVRENLEAALRHLRLVPSSGHDNGRNIRCLWIDAICINQSDKQERSEQVRQMPQIYQAAEKTIVWLGDGTADSDKSMDFMNQNSQRASDMDADLLQARMHREEYLALIRGVLMRPWWERMWIVQEVTVSNTIMVLCGSKSVTWPVLIAFMNIAHEYHKPAVAQILRGVDRKQVRNSNLGIRLTRNRNAWRRSGPLPLHHLITEFRSWKATLPEDKIYGLLGMAVEAYHPSLTPNYDHSPQETFTTVTRCIIEQQQRLDFICNAAEEKVVIDLPSWTPDFTVASDESASPLKTVTRSSDRYLYSASKDVAMAVSFSAESKVMHVEGIRADVVDHLAPHWNTNRSLYDFLEQLIDSTIQPWFELMQPAAAAICARYGKQTDFVTVLGKILTADRVPDVMWKLRRFEPDKSWLDLPVDAPEDHIQDYGGSEEVQFDQWSHRRRHMVAGTITQRRFMITKSGYVGLVPVLTEFGDVICVLFGCDTPVVLRPVRDHFTLVGECYVYGLMDGELVDGFLDGQETKEVFEIR